MLLPFIERKEIQEMRMNRCNSEGYSDPTAYAAICSAARKKRRWMPVVYICSPFSGDVTRNIQNARRYSRFAVDQGCIPIAPHLLFPQFMSEKSERELALFMGNVLMGKCSEVWVFGEEHSEGMKQEIKLARWKNYHLRYFTEEMEEK